MIQIRRAGERGHFDHGWLDTNHTFSFADYDDPSHMGFRALRVINEDRVAPGQGFGTHGHRDMEIVSYVLEGALAHKDSMGTGSVIRPEYNASYSDTTHFLQIWIFPDRDGYAPRYGQKRFERADKLDRLRLVVSPDGADGSIAIRQDAKLYASVLDGGKSASLDLAKGRHAWVQVVRGDLSVNGQKLSAGDGLASSDETRLDFTAGPGETELLAFDLA